MADITRLARLQGAVVKGIDLQTNTPVVLSIKIGGVSNTELTKALLDELLAIRTDLASNANGEGASLIGIEDAFTQFTATNVEGALDEAMDAAQAAQSSADDAQADATQALSDAADAQQDVDDLVTLSGRPANSTDLGTFTGVTIPDASTVKSALQALETSLEALPDPMEYKGNWAASTNTPELEDGVGNNGDVYYVTDAGTVDFGSGNISFEQGDRVVYSGADGEWQKWDTTDQVTSVNGQTGAVSLDTDDIAEGTNKYYSEGQFDASFAAKDTDDLAEGDTNKYFSVAAARAAAVVDSTAGDETDQAASVSAMKDYVTAAVGAVTTDALKEDMPAGESFAATTLFAVRLGQGGETAGRVYKADNDATSVNNFYAIGLVFDATGKTAGQNISVFKAGKLTVTGHGFTAGLPIFLTTSGALSNTAPTAENSAVVRLGFARDANTIEVQPAVVYVN